MLLFTIQFGGFCPIITAKSSTCPLSLSVCWRCPWDVAESFRGNNRVHPLHAPFPFPRLQQNKTDLDVVDCTPQHYHQNTKWGNIFWKNANPCRRAQETAKEHWSCSDRILQLKYLLTLCYLWQGLFFFLPSVKYTMCVQTCYDLPQFGVQVNSAGQKHLHISGSKNRRPGGEEHFKAADVSVDLQQRLHVLCGRDVLGDSLEEWRIFEGVIVVNIYLNWYLLRRKMPRTTKNTWHHWLFEGV